MDRQKGEGYSGQSAPDYNHSYSQSDDSSSHYQQQNHSRSLGNHHPWDATEDHHQSDEDDRFHHHRPFNSSNGEQSNSPGVWEDNNGGYSVPVSGRKRDFHNSAQASPRDMYKATTIVLENIADKVEGSFQSEHGVAFGALIVMRSFEFIFILYNMYTILAISDLLSQALQQKNVDIVNAMDLVSSTKGRLGVLRSEGFDLLMDNLRKVCTSYDIDVPDMGSLHRNVRSRVCQQRGSITIENHYHFDIFNNAVDFQLQELNNRFNDDVVELLKLSSSLDPLDNFKSFNTRIYAPLLNFFIPMILVAKICIILDQSWHTMRLISFNITCFKDCPLFQFCVRN